MTVRSLIPHFKVEASKVFLVRNNRGTMMIGQRGGAGRLCQVGQQYENLRAQLD